MKAELKALHSPDLDLEHDRPSDDSNFGLLVQIMIGPKGEDSSDTFDAIYCTPTWLAEKAKYESPIVGQYYIVASEYNFKSLKHRLENACSTVEGNSWLELVSRLRPIGHWEFEAIQFERAADSP
jgi:hypothetical protein